MPSSNTQRLKSTRADFNMRRQQVEKELDPRVKQIYEAEFEKIQHNLDEATKKSEKLMTRVTRSQALGNDIDQVSRDVTWAYKAYMTASEEARARRAQSYAPPHYPNVSSTHNPAPHPSPVHLNTTRSHHSALPPSGQSMASSQYSRGRPRDSAHLHHSQSDASLNSMDYFNAPQAQSVATFSSDDYFNALEQLPPSLYHPHAPGATPTDPSSVRNSAAPSEIIVYPPSTSHPRATTSSRTGYSRSSRR